MIRQVLREEIEDLEYLDTYWKETNKRLDFILNKIVTEFPVMKQTEIHDIGSAGKLKSVNYSDLYKWNTHGKSDSLLALANKIKHMVHTGKSDGIKRMLEKIATGRIKSLSKPSRGRESEFLGRGHFRWNNKAYVLTRDEIQRVKEYFKL